MKHVLGSKINVTAILVAIISIATLADKLPPQLANLAPWFTLAGMVATVIFRTFYTSNAVSGARETLTIAGKPPLTPTLTLVAAIAGLVLSSCASAPAEDQHYRACLYDRNQAHGLFVTGEVVARDADQRLRFRYDDPAWGDHDDARDPQHGFIWVPAGDEQRVVKRCQAASPFADRDATVSAAVAPGAGGVRP